MKSYFYEHRLTYRNIEQMKPSDSDEKQMKGREGKEQEMSRNPDLQTRESQEWEAEKLNVSRLLEQEKGRVGETLNALEQEWGGNTLEPDGNMATEAVAQSLQRDEVLQKVNQEANKEEDTGEREGTERDPSQADS